MTSLGVWPLSRAIGGPKSNSAYRLGGGLELMAKVGGFCSGRLFLGFSSILTPVYSYFPSLSFAPSTSPVEIDLRIS